MTEFIIRRLTQSIGVLLIMSILVFVGVFAIGDPVEVLINPDATQAEVEQMTEDLGLDKPVWEQYFIFLTNVVKGNLGNSFVFNEPALKLILSHAPATLELAFISMLFAIIIGVPLGMYAGFKPDSLVSKSIMGGSIFGFSLPPFWVALMIIFVFSVKLGWLPASGRGETVDLFGVQVSFLTWDGLTHLILPAFSLGLLRLSLMIRLARAGTYENLMMDYVKFARAKGLSDMRVIMGHILKNIMIPIVTISGLELGNTIAFAVITETIYAWPGMGKLVIDAIGVLDRPVIVAYLMLVVVMFIFINFVVDLLYSVLDPRVRLGDLKS